MDVRSQRSHTLLDNFRLLNEELMHFERGNDKAQPIQSDRQGSSGGRTRLGSRWAAFLIVGGLDLEVNLRAIPEGSQGYLPWTVVVDDIGNIDMTEPDTPVIFEP